MHPCGSRAGLTSACYGNIRDRLEGLSVAAVTFNLNETRSSSQEANVLWMVTVPQASQGIVCTRYIMSVKGSSKGSGLQDSREITHGVRTWKASQRHQPIISSSLSRGLAVFLTIIQTPAPNKGKAGYLCPPAGSNYNNHNPGSPT